MIIFTSGCGIANCRSIVCNHDGTRHTDVYIDNNFLPPKDYLPVLFINKCFNSDNRNVDLLLEMAYISHSCFLWLVGCLAQLCGVLFNVALRDLGGIN